MATINKTNLNKFDSLLKKNVAYLEKQNIAGDDNKKGSLAVSMTILEEYYGLDFQQASDCLTDNSNDCKIDAFFYDQDDVANLIIISSKYKQKSGNTSTFTEDDIDKCIKNIVNLIKGNDIENANEILSEKIKKYKEDLKDEDNPPIKVSLYFATNGIICEEHKLRKSVQDANLDNIVCYFIDATYFGMDATVPDIAILNVNLKEPKGKEDPSDKTDCIFETPDKSLDGIIASCSIRNLLEFYETSGKTALLANNVRFRIKNSAINTAIRETFLKEPDKFSFLNNGITLICGEYQIQHTANGFSKIQLSHPSIVNGGQTTTTLYEEYENNKDKDLFDKAGIVIRICKSNPQFSLRIAEATNSQNKIDIVDLNSNNPNQNLIKKEFEKDGIGLLTKIGEDVVNYDDTINIQSLFQLYAAIYGEEPGKARLTKIGVYKKYHPEICSKDAIEDGIYKKLKRCYDVSRFLEAKKKQVGEDKVFIEYTIYALAYIVRKIDVNFDNLSIPIQNIKLEESYIKAKNILEPIIEQKKAYLGVKFSMNNLFKGNEIKDLIDISLEDIANKP